VKKYCRAEQATDDNTAHAHCRLQTHSDCVMIIASQLQKWLHERASFLGYITLPVLLRFEMAVIIVYPVN
jgi:hypothetical protein